MSRSIARPFVVSTLTLGLVAILPAQSKPDFPGTWTLDTEKSDPMRGPGGGGPMGRGPAGPVVLKVVQTANSLTIERSMGERTQTVVDKLDGSETANTGPRGGEQRSRSRWEGSTLVTDSVQQVSTPQSRPTKREASRTMGRCWS